MKETIVVLRDDIDGTEGVETIRFSVNGTSYEIDLSEKNVAAFHKALSRFVSKATVLERAPSEQAAIREWAQENGYDVRDKGRIAQVVIDAYNAR